MSHSEWEKIGSRFKVHYAECRERVREKLIAVI